MQDEQQYQQLIFQYTQLKNSSIEIAKMIDNEDYDTAITMLKNREPYFLNCKCMRKYLELTPEQQKELDTLLEELKTLELSNIKRLEEEKEKIQQELHKTQKKQKIHHAYINNAGNQGNLINVEE